MKHCAYCGTAIARLSARADYCRRTCREAAWRARRESRLFDDRLASEPLTRLPQPVPVPVSSPRQWQLTSGQRATVQLVQWMASKEIRA